MVESVKAVSDLFTPVGGEVLEINGSLEADPAAVNRDPYGAGWLFKVKLKDAGEKSNLLSAMTTKRSRTISRVRLRRTRGVWRLRANPLR